MSRCDLKKKKNNNNSKPHSTRTTLKLVKTEFLKTIFKYKKILIRNNADHKTMELCLCKAERQKQNKKKNCQPKILYPNKISFSTEFKITSLMNNNNKNKQKIRERYHQQTLSIRKVKRSSSNRRKTIPDGNLDIQKKILSTGNGNYIGKYN